MEFQGSTRISLIYFVSLFYFRLRFVHCSRQFGYSQEEVIDRKWYDLMEYTNFKLLLHLAQYQVFLAVIIFLFFVTSFLSFFCIRRCQRNVRQWYNLPTLRKIILLLIVLDYLVVFHVENFMSLRFIMFNLRRYNELEQPVCRVCDIVMKSEAYWDAHQSSRRHHEVMFYYFKSY